METRNHHRSHGWAWFAILALAAGLLLPQGAAAQRFEVGSKIVADMGIRVWLEKPKKMQMFMRGEWKIFRPRAGALTHHLGVDLMVPESGERIPYARSTSRSPIARAPNG